MRRLKIILTFFVIFCLPAVISQAASRLWQEKNICTAAFMSMASYNDQYGKIATEVLENHHWKVSFRERHADDAFAKFLTAYTTHFVPGQDTYYIAIAGTSDRYDVASDLRMKLIPFDAQNPQALVHKGFDNYAAAVLSSRDYKATLGENLCRELKANPRAHLYLSGHSLGGAVATLMAARFIACGVNPDQITVITFGAPAVGNETFVKKWGDKIHLTRVVMGGDPVRNLIQIVNRHYELFGKKVRYTPLPSYDNKIRHEMLLYADAAIRHYYASKPPIENIAPLPTQGSVFFAEPVLKLPSGKIISSGEANCIMYALKDNLSQYVQRAYWSTSSQMPENVGSCRYIVFTQVDISRMKYKEDSFYVSLSYMVLDAKTRFLKAGFSTACDTQNLTPVEAVLFNALSLRPQLLKTLQS